MFDNIYNDHQIVVLSEFCCFLYLSKNMTTQQPKCHMYECVVCISLIIIVKYVYVSLNEIFVNTEFILFTVSYKLDIQKSH